MRSAQRTLRFLPAVLGVAAITVAMWVGCATLLGDASRSAWLASTVATLSMGIALVGSLLLTIWMTNKGLGIPGVFAGIMARLFPAVGLLLWSQSAGCPLRDSSLAQMIMLNYLVGLVVETYAASRLLGRDADTMPNA